MAIETLRTVGRRLVVVGVLFVIAVALLAEFIPSIVEPAVRMPSGDVEGTGVSADLNTSFNALSFDDQRLHFVVQFKDELTPREVEALQRRLKFIVDPERRNIEIRLDGPLPENAYFLSSAKGDWTGIRDDLVAGKPEVIQIFGIKTADRLSPELGDAAAPTIPDYAITSTGDAALFVTFFDDVPIANQLGTLDSFDGFQPGRVNPQIDDTGVWAIMLPPANLVDLLKEDTVRWIEPTTPPVEEDMNQARGEVGATPASNV